MRPQTVTSQDHGDLEIEQMLKSEFMYYVVVQYHFLLHYDVDDKSGKESQGWAVKTRTCIRAES